MMLLAPDVECLLAQIDSNEDKLSNSTFAIIILPLFRLEVELVDDLVASLE